MPRRPARAGHAPKAAAVTAVTAELGRGIAGLVNALDPDPVSLGGLAAYLAEAAPDALQSNYTAGLMNFRRSTLVPVVPAQLGVDGPLIGAVETAWDQVLRLLCRQIAPAASRS